MGKEGKGRGGGRGGKGWKGKGKYLPDQCQTASGAPGNSLQFMVISIQFM